jgi:hypothetical protein
MRFKLISGQTAAKRQPLTKAAKAVVSSSDENDDADSSLGAVAPQLMPRGKTTERMPIIIYDMVTARFDNKTGGWFCYLMKQLGGFSKNLANIKMSPQPYVDILSHNRGDANDKTTKPAKGHWQIEMLIGPLEKDESEHIKKEWMATSRGLTSRRERGLEIVLELRKHDPNRAVYCFDKRLVPIPLAPYLRRIRMECLGVSDEVYWKLISAVSISNPAKKRFRL